MYIHVQELKSLGFSKRKTAQVLAVHRATVSKYWDITTDEYTTMAEKIKKQSCLAKYEPAILGWLYRHPSMTAAQVYDWLLEHYRLNVSERLVRRYVGTLRRDHKLKKTSHPREYEAVEELPLGHQMQIDFGQQSMRTPDGQYVKVYFIGVVLSHSRYKWGYFLDRPFCSVDLVNCLDMCFEHCGGVANELVFDQDSIVTVSENYGDIIYTYEFEKYRKLHSLQIYLCRKADPESKGIVESVVKYVKGNFLPNRYFMNIDILNQSFTEWLDRTGNGKVHGTTKKIPAKVFEVERAHLRPILTAMEVAANASINRMVRKDNTIIYESNRYSVPLGTYTREKEVAIDIKDNKLIITNIFGDYVIAEHQLCTGKGKLIKITNHGRDWEHGISELAAALSKKLGSVCDTFLKEIRQRKRRYIRDQFGLIDTLIKEHGAPAVIRAAQYCLEQELFSATDVKDALNYFAKQEKKEQPVVVEPVMSIMNRAAGTVTTQKRSIDSYTGLGGEAI